MISFNPMTAGYLAIGILALFSATFASSIRFLRARAENSLDISLKQDVPTAPEGICSTTLWITNSGRKPIFIRNIIIGCGTFSGNEIRNILGQVTGYQHGTDMQRAFNISIEPGTQTEDSITFHAQIGIPVTATLVGKNGVYDIHLRQPERKY